MNPNAKALIPALSILVSLSSAFADIECPSFVPFPFSRIETRIEAPDGPFGAGKRVIEGQRIDCAKISIAANMVLGLKKMLSPDVKTPNQIIFRMVDTFSNAFYSPTDASLNVPFQMMFGKYKKNPVFSVPVWAHEYGHAVFRHNTTSAWEKWTQSLMPIYGWPSDKILNLLTGPYNEFFADVVAVLYSDRGDAVSRGLFMTGNIANPEGSPNDCPATEQRCRRSGSSERMMALMITPRDFTARENQFSRWRGTNPQYIHNVLAPARYHIWKYYISNPLYKNQKDRIAGLTLDAIIGEVSRRLNRLIQASDGNIDTGDINDEINDVRRVNAEFIQTLNTYLTEGLRK